MKAEGRLGVCECVFPSVDRVVRRLVRESAMIDHRRPFRCFEQQQDFARNSSGGNNTGTYLKNETMSILGAFPGQ